MVSARLTKGVAGVIAVAIALSAVAGTTTPRAQYRHRSCAQRLHRRPNRPWAARRRRRATGAGHDRGRDCRPGGDDGVREVPAEYPTIQAAVDAAAEGDLVLAHLASTTRPSTS